MKRISIAVAALVAAVFSTSCDRRTNSVPPATSNSADSTGGAGDGLTLKTYKVPSGYAERLRPVLSTVLRQGDNTVGRVDFSPDGQLLVVAPPGVQAGIAELVQNLAGAGPAAPPTVEMTYWLVLGHPGRSADEGECGPQGLGCVDGGKDGTLAKALAPVIAQQSRGMSVTQLQKLSMKALESEDGQLSGPNVDVKQVASLSGERIIAHVRVWVGGEPGSVMDTRLQFKPDETVVLGQVGYAPAKGKGDGQGAAKGEGKGEAKGEGKGEPSDSDAVLFVVVRGAVHR